MGFIFFFIYPLDTDNGDMIYYAPLERTDTVMIRREDERGHIVRVYEEGDGMRRRFYGALEDRWFLYPRRIANKHALSWYCDGHLEARPISGIWACATLAEHLLALSKDTRRAVLRPDFRDAARFFAATRRAMKSILTHYKVTTRLTRSGVSHARKTYKKLCRDGSEILASVELLTPTSRV